MANDKKFQVKNGLTAQNVSYVDDIGTPANTINVEMLTSDTLSFEGDSGQLFSITDDLTGTIFSVNDISGIPSIEVDADGEIRFAEFDGNVGIGKASPATKLDVNGTTSTTAISIAGEIIENVFALTGTTPALDPANGTIQTWTLTANSTPTSSLASGESLLLLVDDGTAYTITWPTMEWIGGSAPTLDTANTNVIELWKVGSTLYGALVGVSS